MLTHVPRQSRARRSDGRDGRRDVSTNRAVERIGAAVRRRRAVHPELPLASDCDTVCAGAGTDGEASQPWQPCKRSRMDTAKRECLWAERRRTKSPEVNSFNGSKSSFSNLNLKFLSVGLRMSSFCAYVGFWVNKNNSNSEMTFLKTPKIDTFKVT